MCGLLLLGPMLYNDNLSRIRLGHCIAGAPEEQNDSEYENEN